MCVCLFVEVKKTHQLYTKANFLGITQKWVSEAGDHESEVLSARNVIGQSVIECFAKATHIRPIHGVKSNMNITTITLKIPLAS